MFLSGEIEKIKRAAHAFALHETYYIKLSVVINLYADVIYVSVGDTRHTLCVISSN